MPRNFKKRKGLSKSDVQKMIAKNIETKLRQEELINTTVSTTGTNYDLCSIGTGDGQTTRSGHQVNVTGFYGKFQLVASDATNALRVVMYIPKDSDDILTGTTTYSLIDLDRFTILSDKLYTVSLNGINQRVFTLSKKFRGKGLQVQWATSGATDISRNALKMWVVSDSVAISHPILNGHYRTYFKDA